MHKIFQKSLIIKISFHMSYNKLNTEYFFRRNLSTQHWPSLTQSVVSFHSVSKISHLIRKKNVFYPSPPLLCPQIKRDSENFFFGAGRRGVTQYVLCKTHWSNVIYNLWETLHRVHIYDTDIAAECQRATLWSEAEVPINISIIPSFLWVLGL